MKGKVTYHSCGYPIVIVERRKGIVSEKFFVDGKNPITKDRAGNPVPAEVETCPECGGFIKMERLRETAPTEDTEKRPSGYIPARGI